MENEMKTYSLFIVFQCVITVNPPKKTGLPTAKTGKKKHVPEIYCPYSVTAVSRCNLCYQQQSPSKPLFCSYYRQV